MKNTVFHLLHGIFIKAGTNNMHNGEKNFLQCFFPTNTPRVFHVKTSWKRSFPRPFNVEQYCQPTSYHPHHCKKGIPYSQTLRLNRICSDNSNFDKLHNELKSWLFQKDYNENMVRNRIHGLVSFLEKVYPKR